MTARVAFALGLALAAAGCGTLDTIRQAIASIVQPGGSKTAIEALRVEAEPQANQDSATALDLVFAYEPQAAAQLPKSAAEWFAKKAELVNLLAGGIEVLSLQVPPATALASVALPRRYEFAVRVLAYPNYFAREAPPPGDLTRLKKPLITLKPETVVYAER